MVYDSSMRGLASPSEMAFDAVAFDLVDKCGRTFPLLLHFRSGRLPDDEDLPIDEGYDAAGALLSRDSANTILATISCPEQCSAALHLTDDSASFFATYAPHRDVEAKYRGFSQLSPLHDGEPVIVRARNGVEGHEVVSGMKDRNDEWVSLWAAANQPGACEHTSSSDSEALATQTRERGRVVLEEVRTLCCAAGVLCSLQPEQFSMFSAYHPPAVVRSFTVAALSPILLSVPSDVLGIIADYAWLGLPYLPMPLRLWQSEWSSSAFYETVDDLEDMDPVKGGYMGHGNYFDYDLEDKYTDPYGDEDDDVEDDFFY